ncbi:MAG: hypothetical protein BMS9Abin28_2281 [Anaerolineae bacterium]|nr:MAG: hypothetical protein BMS9Abin28_2281 [Anaerolineae bacterium]
MDFSNVVGLLAALLIGIVILLVIWAVVVRRRSAEIEAGEVPPESLGAVSAAKYEADELPAALVSEQIEEMVKQRLASYPDLADVKLDFATGSDESLVIWVDDQNYTDIDQIPDDRIRAAISEAVETFNR